MKLIHVQLAMAAHRQAIVETFGLLKEAMNRLSEKMKKARELNHSESIQLINEAIDRLKLKYKHEEEEQVMMNTITIEEYEKKFPDKIEKMKSMFGDFIK